MAENKPRILFLIPTDYDSLVAKGVANMILENDENGFFERVVRIHPVAKVTRVIDLSPVHVIYEIGLDLFPGSNRFRILKYLQVPIHFFRILRTIFRVIRLEKIDLIRATSPDFCGAFAWLASKYSSRRIPFCISIHADYDSLHELDPGNRSFKLFGSRRLMKVLERFVLSRAPMVMPIRKSLGERAVKNGACPEAIRIIPHGIDFAPFESLDNPNVRERFGLGADKSILSFVGRLSHENYVDDLIELARRLKGLREDWVLVMAGGGSEEGRLRAILESEPALKSVVLLVGFQAQEVIVPLRRQSTVNLCLMGGFSLIEACAGARPVVAYDVQWHHELVRTGETGFLVPEGNLDELLKSVLFLLDNPAEAAAWGRNARELAREKHSRKNTSAVKIKHYRELLAHGKPKQTDSDHPS